MKNIQNVLSPKERWKITDKISWLSVVISLIALVFSITLSIFGYRSQSRYNDLQNRLLLQQNVPELRCIGSVQSQIWLGDDEPFICVDLENVGTIPALHPIAEANFQGARNSYTQSHQIAFYDPGLIIGPKSNFQFALGPEREIKEDFEKANPGLVVLKFVTDVNYLAPTNTSKAFKELGIPAPQNGELQTLFLRSVSFVIKYTSPFDHKMTLYITLFAVAKER